MSSWWSNMSTSKKKIGSSILLLDSAGCGKHVAYFDEHTPDFAWLPIINKFKNTNKKQSKTNKMTKTFGRNKTLTHLTVFILNYVTEGIQITNIYSHRWFDFPQGHEIRKSQSKTSQCAVKPNCEAPCPGHVETTRKPNSVCSSLWR